MGKMRNYRDKASAPRGKSVKLGTIVQTADGRAYLNAGNRSVCSDGHSYQHTGNRTIRDDGKIYWR